jgi:hypothetical protein
MTETTSALDWNAIQSAVQTCFEESFPDGIPDEENVFERQKRDFVIKFKDLAQQTKTHEELLALVTSSYDLFIGEVNLRSLETKKSKLAEDDNLHLPYFNVRKEDWIVYLVIALVSILSKWADERYASNFAKKHGMQRHVLMKVIIYAI